MHAKNSQKPSHRSAKPLHATPTSCCRAVRPGRSTAANSARKVLAQAVATWTACDRRRWASLEKCGRQVKLLQQTNCQLPNCPWRPEHSSTNRARLLHRSLQFIHFFQEFRGHSQPEHIALTVLFQELLLLFWSLLCLVTISQTFRKSSSLAVHITNNSSPAIIRSWQFSCVMAPNANLFRSRVLRRLLKGCLCCSCTLRSPPVKVLRLKYGVAASPLSSLPQGWIPPKLFQAWPCLWQQFLDTLLMDNGK